MHTHIFLGTIKKPCEWMNDVTIPYEMNIHTIFFATFFSPPKKVITAGVALFIFLLRVSHTREEKNKVYPAKKEKGDMCA